MIAKSLPGYLVLLVFAFSGSDKLVNQTQFQADLLKVFYLNERWIIALSIVLPILELLLVAAATFPASGKAGFAGLLILLALFTLHLGVMEVFSPSVPCSCGGIIENLTIGEHLAVNVLLMGCCVYSLRTDIP